MPLEPWMVSHSPASSSTTPRLYLSNFCHPDKYYPSQVRSCVSAIEHGVQRCFIYRQENLDHEMLEIYKELFALPRGYGHWAWKPYIILAALENLEEGDVVMYTDVDSRIKSDLTPLYELALEHDIVLFEDKAAYLRSALIKRDALIIMNADDDPRYIEGNQLWAAISLWKKTWRTKRFLNEWLTYALDIRVSSDLPNVLGKPNHPGFFENRHDQSTLDVLALRWGIKPFPCPIRPSKYWPAPLIANDAWLDFFVEMAE